MAAMATNMVRKIYTWQRNIIWISVYHFMMLWKGYKNFDFFHKIWKAYLEWYTGALGMECFKKIWTNIVLSTFTVKARFYTFSDCVGNLAGPCSSMSTLQLILTAAWNYITSLERKYETELGFRYIHKCICSRVEFSRSQFVTALSQEWEGRLTWNNE